MRNDDLDAKGKDVGGSAAANGAAAVGRKRKKRRSWSAGEEDPDRAGEFFYPGVGDGRGPALRDRAQPAIGLAQSSAPGQAGGAVIGAGGTAGLLPTLRWKNALRW